MMEALFLASYPSLVLQNDPYKACFEYFHDMFKFLTDLVTKSEFFRSGSSMELISDKGILASQRFISGVVSGIFNSKNDVRYVAEHLFQFVNRPQIETFSPASFFLKLLEFDQHLRKLLSNFPSGPLMKALDFIKDPDRPTLFAPLRENLPQNMFNATYLDKTVSVFAQGSPTVQRDVKQADIDPLFQVFLDQLEGQTTVMILLEDRFNNHNTARVQALLDLAKENVVISNIPRAGFFYQQQDVYAFVDEASEFKKLILEQFDTDESAVYSVSGLFEDDVGPLVEFIHDKIFDNKDKLNLRERLIFIELLNMFMALKLLEKHEADNLVIICKDGIDHANAFSLSIQAFSYMHQHENLLTKDMIDMFISELYGPSMTIRDRPIFEESLVRMCSALSFLHAKLLKEPNFSKVIEKVLPVFKTLKVKKTS